MELLVLQHIDCEGPGLLEEFAGVRGHTLQVVPLFACEPVPPLAGFGGLVVLGGPMNAYQEDRYPFLRDEDRLLRQAVESDMPVLGICLGAQLLAKAMGAAITPNAQKEVGYCDIALTEEGRANPLFARLSSHMPVFQWHGDTFAIPAAGANLATSDACTNQAFRVGRRAYGLQFHLEITPEMVGQWIVAYRSDLDEVHGVNSGGRLVKDARLMDWLMRRQAQVVFTNFLRIAEEPR